MNEQHKSEHKKYCPVCQGVGQVDTGINESPVTVCNACNGTGIKAQPAVALEQEPVAWMHIQGRHKELSHCPLDDGEISRGWEQYPLYTTPPQRTWVGLTDEEIETLIHRFDGDPHTLLDEVNARLKEKNT